LSRGDADHGAGARPERRALAAAWRAGPDVAAQCCAAPVVSQPSNNAHSVVMHASRAMRLTVSWATLGNAVGSLPSSEAQTATAHVQLHGDRRARRRSKPAPQVGGFYLANIPAWIAWLKYLSFVYFGYNLLLKAEFRGRTLWDCGGGNPPHPSAQAGCTAVPPGGLQAKLHLQARPRGPTPVGLWRMRVLSRARPRHAVATGWRALARTFAARRSTGAHAPCAVVCKSWGCSSASCQSIYDLLREEGPNLTGLLP